MSKETPTLKALKETVEEARTQHNKFRDEVLMPLWEANPKILSRWEDAKTKVMKNYDEFVIPKVSAHARAECEAMFQAAEVRARVEKRKMEAEG